MNNDLFAIGEEHAATGLLLPGLPKHLKRAIAMYLAKATNVTTSQPVADKPILAYLFRGKNEAESGILVVFLIKQLFHEIG